MKTKVQSDGLDTTSTVQQAGVRRVQVTACHVGF
jgi:hypothetical protein